MNRIRYTLIYLAVLLGMLAACFGQTPAGFTNVTGSHTGGDGNLISNATITFSPVSNNGQSISYKAGGNGGVVTVQPVSAQVTNGVFTLNLPDSSLTQPANVCYSVQITDNTSGNQLLGPGYGCVQPTGSAWSLDSYVPAMGALALVSSGPQGIQGISAYQVAVGNGFGGTQAQWLSSLQGSVTAPGLAAGAGAADSDALAALGLGAGRNRFDGVWTVGGLACPSGAFTAGSPTYFRVSDPIFIADLTSFSANFTAGNTTNDPTYVIYDENLNVLACVVNGQPAATSYPNVPGGIWVRIEDGLQSNPPSGPAWVGGGTTPTGVAPAYGYSYPDAGYIASLKQKLPDPTQRIPQQTATAELTTDASQPYVRNLFDPARATPGLTFDLSCYNNPTWYQQYTNGPGSPTYNNCINPYESQGANNGQVGSALIPVIPGETLYLSQGDPNGNTSQGNVFYDANRVPIRSTLVPQPTAAGTITVPASAPANSGIGVSIPAFYRIFASSAYQSLMLLSNQSAAYSGPFIPFAQQPSTSQTRSPWNGKKVAVFGDSYTAAYGYEWLPALLQYHNMTEVFQDARAGRPIGDDALPGEGILECYGNDGINGKFNPSYQPHGGAYGNCAQASPLAVSGNTLAQNLNLITPDLILVPIGTNTYNTNTLGSVTDAVNAATVHGQLKAVLTALHTDVPNARVVFVEPVTVADTTLGRNTMMTPTALAEEQECALFGDPVIKLNSESGINTLNTSVFERDGIHLTDAAYPGLFAPAIALKLNSITPMH